MSITGETVDPAPLLLQQQRFHHLLLHRHHQQCQPAPYPPHQAYQTADLPLLPKTKATNSPLKKSKKWTTVSRKSSNVKKSPPWQPHEPPGNSPAPTKNSLGSSKRKKTGAPLPLLECVPVLPIRA